VVQTQFYCHLLPEQQHKNQLIVYPPTNVPHVIELKSNPNKGYMLSNVFSLTVHNTFSQPITLEFSLENPVGEETAFNIRTARNFMNENEINNTLISIYSIAPGQTMSLPLEIIPDQLQKKKNNNNNNPQFGEVFIGCRDSRVFNLVIAPSRGPSMKVGLDLSCRKQDQSFLYSFLDHDGSVAQAGIVLPLNYHTPNYKTLGLPRINRNKEEDALPKEFPVLLSLHGSGIQPQNHADAHKYMPPNTKNYLFGVVNYFLVAPSRFGAHNWEGVGDLTARTALLALQKSIQLSNGLLPSVDLKNNMISGHSMGGHGVWVTAMNQPSLYQCLLPTSGWIKKEEYGNSNLFFQLDVSSSFIPTGLKSLMERALSEYHVDHLVSNVETSHVHIRVGSHDFTTHPWYSRRMFRLLKSRNINATMEEIMGKQHWWWDTQQENDGGVLNDLKMRSFYSFCYSLYAKEQEIEKGYYQVYLKESRREVKEDDSFINYLTALSTGNRNLKKERDVPAVTPLDEYLTSSRCDYKNITLTVMNPAVHEGYCGIQVLQQHQPLALSTVKVSCSYETKQWMAHDNIQERKLKRCFIQTGNVRRFSFQREFGQSLFEAQELIINHRHSFPQQPSHPTASDGSIHICLSPQNHQMPTDCSSPALFPLLEKTLITYGPIRRVYDRPFVIVYGTPSGQSLRITLKDFALYLANSHYTSHYTSVQVFSDLEYMTTSNYLKKPQLSNVIFIGDATQNKFLKSVLSSSKAAKSTSSTRVIGRLPADLEFFDPASSSSSAASSDLLSQQEQRKGFKLNNWLFQEADQGILFTFPFIRTSSESISANENNENDELNGFATESMKISVEDHHIGMGLVISANSVLGYHHLSRLAWPVIPPMVRAPFANYLPDYMIIDHQIWDKGFGGVLAAGYWDMEWKYDEKSAFVAAEYI
jgi:hypothetical protein